MRDNKEQKVVGYPERIIFVDPLFLKNLPPLLPYKIYNAIQNYISDVLCQSVLRIGAAQLLFLDVPIYAAVKEMVDVLRSHPKVQVPYVMGRLISWSLDFDFSSLLYQYCYHIAHGPHLSFRRLESSPLFVAKPRSNL